MSKNALDPEKFDETLDEDFMTPFRIRCEYCKRTPEIRVKGDKAEIIKVKCVCGIDKIMTNSEYIKKMRTEDFHKRDCEKQGCQGDAVKYCVNCEKWLCQEHLNKENTSHKFSDTAEIDQKCTEHRGENVSFYCKYCKRHICKRCLEDHQSHQTRICDLNAEFQPERLNEKLTNYLKLALNQIKENRKQFCAFREKLVKLIRNLQEDFLENERINKNIYSLLNAMKTTYDEEKSFFVYYGINEISKFNIQLDFYKQKIAEKENINSNNNEFDAFTKFYTREFILSREIPNYLYDLKDFSQTNSEKLGETYNLVQLDNNTLASCGEGIEDGQPNLYGKIYILDKETLKLVKRSDTTDKSFNHDNKKQGNVNYICTRPRVLTESVRESAVVQTKEDYLDILSCGSEDGNKKIRVWSYKKEKFEKSIEIKDAHQESINKLITLTVGKLKVDEKIIPDRFASCSDDRTIKIWNLYKPNQTKYPLMKIEGHNEAVKCIVQIAGQNLIVSSSVDNLGNEDLNSIHGEVKIWDISGAKIDNLETIILTECRQSWPIKCGYMNSIVEVTGFKDKEITNGDIICGSIDGSIYILKKQLHEFKYVNAQKISHGWFKDASDYYPITGGGVSAFNVLQDGSIIVGCPNGKFIQIVNKKDQEGNTYYEPLKNDKIVTLGKSEEDRVDVIAFTNIKIGDRIYYYAAFMNGAIIQYSI